MPVDSLRDLRAVLFPPILMTFFLAVFALPVALLLASFTSPNVGWLFAATSLGYFLNYEFLHLAYHLPPQYAVARWPLVGRLKGLHTAHHDPRLMAHYNFNISYPLGDWLFGTLYRGPSRPLKGRYPLKGSVRFRAFQPPAAPEPVGRVDDECGPDDRKARSRGPAKTPRGTRSTPIRNCRLGPMYCTRPIVDSGIRRAP